MIFANIYSLFSIGRYHHSTLQVLFHLIFTMILKGKTSITFILWMGKAMIIKVKQVVQGYPDRRWSETPDPRRLQSLSSYRCETNLD